MTIDWNAPLEAYHPDGRVVEVELHKGHGQPDVNGYHHITPNLEPDNGYCFRHSMFRVDGGHRDGAQWRIRNRTEKPAPQYPVELVERMVDYVRDSAVLGCDRALALVADLPQPVDPDLELAIDVVASYYDIKASKIASNLTDVELCLAAIKRIRALQEQNKESR